MNRLEILLAAWEDGTLDAPQAAELKQLLSDPQARKALVDDWQFYGSLCAAMQTLPAEAAPASPPARTSLWAGLTAWWRWTMAGAVAASLALLAGWFFFSPAPIGRLSGVQGQVMIVSGSKTNAAAAQQLLLAGQVVLVPPGGAAVVAWEKEATLVRLGPDSELTLGNRRDAKQLRLARGQLLAAVAPQAQNHPLVIRTPQAEAVVKGTRFTLSANRQATRLEVMEGAVALRKHEAQDSVTVTPGNFAVAQAGASLLMQPGTNCILRELVLQPEGRIAWCEPVAGVSAEGQPFGFSGATTNSLLHRLRGCLTAPATGEFAFWVAASPAGEFWLSTDEHPAGLRRLAAVETPGNSSAPRKSVPLRLEAGHRYYFEARQPFSPGGSLAVGWVRPAAATGSLAEIIGPEFISPPMEPVAPNR
jgi:hypothetical protein